MNKQQGFTLVELLVALTVIIILATVAVPSLRTFIQNGKMVTQTNQLVTALNFGRSEAIKRRTPVVVCALNTAQNACTSSTISWDTNGWMAFADRDNDGAYDADDGDATLEDGEDLLLKQWTQIKGKDDIDITVGKKSLTYRHTGALAGTTAVGMKVSIDDSSQPDRCVRVTPTGRVEYEKMSDGVSCP
ncbi:MAG: GspH/FimT family pseudopilin [Gammaproteobacteria bacterium]